MYNKKAIYNYIEKHREEVNLYKRTYYAERCEDPEFLEKERLRSRVRCKERYDADPDYKAKKNERRKAAYHKKKSELLANTTINALPILPIMVEATA